MQNYELLVDRIAKQAGISVEEVDKKVEARRAKLSGLISREGAAQIIAAELGISFENQDLKINELMVGMKKVNVFGKIINLFPVHEFERNGNTSKVVNFILADDTGTTKIVLWDSHHIEKIEKQEIKKDDFVEIKNGSVRDGEIHLSSFSEFNKSEKSIENIKTSAVVIRKKIEELQQGQNVEILGVVVQMFAPRFFYVCPECGKKATQETEGFTCVEHGRVQGKERAVLTLVLDDGTESVRIVLFSDQISMITSEDKLKSPEGLAGFREDVLGSVYSVKGNVKKNQLFNNLEINVSAIEKVNPDNLIAELENQ